MNRINRLVFEGRLLVNLTGSIMRQDDLHPIHGRLDWERMYRTADYHKIANMTYLAILGNGERIDPSWQERFFERYQEALRYSEICVNAEYEILALLDMTETPCVLLASCGVRDLYQLPEIAANSPLRLFFALESYGFAKGFLVDLGYEIDRTYAGYGERMKHQRSGFLVDIYFKLPFMTKIYQKQMLKMLEHAYIRSSYQFIRILSLEDRFILRVAEAAYHYVVDELVLRELMDINLYYKSWQDQMNKEYIKKMLYGFRIDELAEKLIQLSRMWFGAKEDPIYGNVSEEMSVYDVLENRILSRGQINNEIDVQAIYVAHQIDREENRERNRKRRERIKEQIQGHWNTFARKLRWVFPEYRYMCSLYPLIERIPVLLLFFWIRRIVRLLFRMLKDSFKH